MSIKKPISYIPYDEEWKKGMMKLKKMEIINIASKIGIENIKLNNLLDIFKFKLDLYEKGGDK